MMRQPGSTRNGQRPGLVMVGALAIGIGLMLLSGRHYLLDVHVSAHMWPLVLLVMGVARLTGGAAGIWREVRQQRVGVWLVFLGLWGLISEYGLFGMDYGNSWLPLLVGTATMIVWRSLDPGGCGAAGQRVE